VNTALLLVRLIVGLAIAAHGSQKLFGWFGGYGLAGTAGFFASLGFRPGVLFVLGAGLSELGGGLLTALGLGGPIGPALIIMVMLVAILTVHLPKGFWAQNGGYELNLMYVAAALALAFAGFGAFALDRAFGIAPLADANETWLTIGAAVALALLNLLARAITPSISDRAHPAAH
jgi:putative oxidoreductase